ncbi:MAG: ABC transporter substrate-binding protein [Coriobacteriia bacterium]|nr:ABC transporter substrate-binding protein [Coriobacteriia bacterium]
MRKHNNKTVSVSLVLCIILSLLCSCSPYAENGTPQNSENEASEKPTELKIKYAQYFSIQYMEKGIKLITDAEGRVLLLVPDDVDVPSGYDDANLVRTPIQKAFYGSPTHIGQLAVLDQEFLYDSIIALSTDPAQWTNPEITKRFENGQIEYVPTSGMSLPDIETILTIDPDVYFIDAQPSRSEDLLFDEVGIYYSAVGEYLEKSYEAQIEWIKYFGAFYNIDEYANTVFEEKIARLVEIRSLAANLAEDEKPLVACGMYSSGTIYTRTSDSMIAKGIRDTGGIYYIEGLFAEGNPRISMEDFFDNARDADILIYTIAITFMPDRASLIESDPLFGDIKAVQNNQVYIFAADYYMNNVQADVLLEDMLTILHPDLMPDHELRLIVKLPD